MPERKPIAPELRRYLDEQAASAPDVTRMSDPERVSAARASLVNALKSRDSIPGLPNAVQTRDVELAGGRPGRAYLPAHPGPMPKPMLVYLHGGGWVAGSLSTHDPFCRLLAEAADLVILSVDYRQPPENPFPAAVDDALAAVHWAAEHANELGAHPERLALGGDSAGGNLAAVAANVLAVTPHAPRLSAQVLLFPVTDHPSAKHPSYEENATGYGLTAENMSWYWRQYVGDASPDEPGFSPLRLDPMPPLPPTLVLTSEYDVLRDEGTAYAEKLRRAGVATTHLHAPDMHHNFPVSPGTVARFAQSQTTLNEVAGWLRAMMHVALPGSLRTAAD